MTLSQRTLRSPAGPGSRQRAVTGRILIVAPDLDTDPQCIVTYLAARGIAINVLCFSVFAQNGQQLPSQAWLRDRAAELPLKPTSARGSRPRP